MNKKIVLNMKLLSIYKMGRQVLSFTRELDHDLKAEPSEHDDPHHCAVPAIYKDGLK
jgi:hypothetical protein